jgi:PAS domain S-box-containing protein
LHALPVNQTQIMPSIKASGLEGIFDLVDLGLIVLDADMRVLAWNGWMEAATGQNADEARQNRLDEVFPNVVNARLITAVGDALNAGTSSILSHSLHAAVFPLKTRNGRALIHNVVVRPLAGVVPRCLVQISDVTVAVERDRMLRERQNARYDVVVDSAPDAILTLDTNGVILFANPAASHEFGYAAREFFELPVSALFDVQTAWHAVWNNLLTGGRLTRSIQLVARKKDGSLSFMEMSAATWQGDSRVFVTAILRNVNERHRAEQALRHLNQTLEKKVAERTADRDRMWQLSSELMLVAQLDGTINTSNPAWRALTGQILETLNQGRLEDFVLADDHPKLQAILHELGHTRAHGHFELRHRAHDGAIRWISWSAVAADDLLQAVGRDVTVEREAGEALQAAEEALRQSQKMEAIGQLTGCIAHDFNNLLTGISGGLELLETRLAQKRYTDLDRYIGAAKRSANRAAALTHRLLAFSRRQTLDPRATDINRLIREMDDLVRRTVGPTIDVSTSLDPALGTTLVDSNQLENALLNLCINARDAMPGGGRLTIETTNTQLDANAAREQDVPPGEYVTLCVRDTGGGMPEGVIEHAFDPFFTTKPLGEGTGLGLSMVYGFVRQSGGQARILSELGQGTAVQLYLPRHDESELAQEAPLEQAEIHRASKGETVLVVDDEPPIRMLIGEVLEDLGYRTIEAHDGAAGFKHLQAKGGIDLLITDVGLPGGINGRQLADAALTLRPDLKVLFITGYAENSIVTNLKPGMHVMTKPFTIDALASRIQDILTGH